MEKETQSSILCFDTHGNWNFKWLEREPYKLCYSIAQKSYPMEYIVL